MSHAEPAAARRVRTGMALLVTLLALGTAPARAQDGPDPRAVLETTLGEAGIRLDLEARRCSIGARVLVRTELLEYLLVGSGGAAHESLFVSDVQPSLLNTALLALGVEPGRNARWFEKDPLPSEEELRAGVSPYDVYLPEGDAFYLHALWREGEEVYFFRVEDLVRNLASGRTMRRHPWVFLGSRFTTEEEGEAGVFVADREQNLVNIAYFPTGNTLVTAALAASVDQTIWVGNSWLLPERGAPITLVFSRDPLVVPPPELVAGLPDAAEVVGDGADAE